MPPPLPAPTRFHALDALRGVAALAVVFFHWQNFFFEGTSQSPHFVAENQPFYAVFRLLYDRGDLAVDLFFSLSGFIFFWLYSERVAAHRLAPCSFFVLRASRLYPLHALTLLLVALGQAVHLRQSGSFFVYPFNDAHHFGLHLLLLSSVGLERGFSFNTPAWSISVEAVLYLLFFAVCWMRGGGRPVLLVGLALLGLFVVSPAYLPLGRGIGSFFLGGCTYQAYCWVVRQPSRRLWSAAAIGLASALWLATVTTVYLDLSPLSHPLLRRFQWKFPLVVLFPLTILALALFETLRGPTAQRLAFLGDISYSSYLWHFPLQLAFGLSAHALGLSSSVYMSPACFLIFFALLIVLSMASHKHFEMPMQSWLRRRLLGRGAKVPQ